MKVKIFTALDFSEEDKAIALVKKTVSLNPYFKVGLELYVSQGPEIVKKLRDLGAEIFLDLKFHDIPNTVAAAVKNSAKLGVGWLNIHCGGGAEMMRASVDAMGDGAASSTNGVQRPLLLGVTVLTSLDDQAISEIGFPRSASAQVKHFVELAQANGLDGVVCSSLELPLVYSLAKKSFCTMVPGIRPADADMGDQKRVATPELAAKAGAHCLVIGRPITAAKDPVSALKKILEQV